MRTCNEASHACARNEESDARFAFISARARRIFFSAFGRRANDVSCLLSAGGGMDKCVVFTSVCSAGDGLEMCVHKRESDIKRRKQQEEGSALQI